MSSLFAGLQNNLKSMKVNLWFWALQLLTLVGAFAQEFSLSSPNGENVINITLGERLSYRVLHNKQALVIDAPISITVDDKVCGVEPSLKNSKKQSVSKVLRPIVKTKQKEIIEKYNELTLEFKGNYAVSFRAYNEGVAYRFEMDLEGEVKVQTEQIRYNFPKHVKGSFPISDGFFSHQERTTFTYPLDSLPSTEMSCLPVLIHHEKGVKSLLTEADLYDYPGFYLKKGEGSSLEAVFPYYPKKTIQPRDRDVKVVEREAFMAKTIGRRTFPWRIMAIADNDGELLTNQLVYLLSRDNDEMNFDWVKPGKVAWDWYNANNIFGVDFKAGINTETYTYYIDFAAQAKLQYIIIDEGWYDIKTGDLQSPIPEIDLEELIRYGNEKGVGIILWVTWKALDDQFETAMDQFQAWGVKGLKIDFMKRDDQWMVNFYERAAKAAAQRQLLIDFHGSHKPAGLRRAYPNVLTSEGVLGLEQNKVSQISDPENNLVIPFTRMFTGPLDYTPGAMVNAQKENHRPNFHRPMSLGTRCHQLAMYVVYESPLQMLADSPSNYLKEAECLEFLSAVPTVWDDTKVLDAQFSDYVLLARKSGEQWFLGAMTDWDSRDIEVDFSFLEEGEYTMVIYQDGVNAHRHAEDYKRSEHNVTANDHVKIHLAPGGGWVAWVKKN